VLVSRFTTKLKVVIVVTSSISSFSIISVVGADDDVVVTCLTTSILMLSPFNDYCYTTLQIFLTFQYQKLRLYHNFLS
jgi:hypothetical protein